MPQTIQIVNYEASIPEPVSVADKPELEKLRLFEQLDEDDKATIFSLVEKMLTNKKFKDFLLRMWRVSSSKC